MSRNAIVMVGLVTALIGACGKPADERATDRVATRDIGPISPPSSAAAPEPSAASPGPLVGEAVVLAEWRRAANRGNCAPLALRSDGKAGGIPRAATFSGGWAVAFDQPGRRSAYGIAGVGALPEDKLDFAVQVDRLTAQWPLVRRWDAGENLPSGSAAGYSLEGAQPYPEGSTGVGRQSLAYLRIPGQSCLYNVWSKLGRDHLELLLARLTIIDTDG